VANDQTCDQAVWPVAVQQAIDIDAALRHGPLVVGPRSGVNVAIDWTEFDGDDQATLLLSLLTQHGRATPLLW